MTGRVKKLVRKVIRDRNRVAADRSVVSAKISLDMDTIPSDPREKILSSKVVAAYMPLPDEPDISEVLSAFEKNGATVCFPKVFGEDMTFFSARASECRNIGSFGIFEPDADSKKILPEEMDLVLVPAMAFSEEGVRLGRGKGYYDKFFSGSNGFHGILIGVVAKKDLFPHLPSDVWDLTVNAILTEEGMILPKERSGKN